MDPLAAAYTAIILAFAACGFVGGYVCGRRGRRRATRGAGGQKTSG